MYSTFVIGCSLEPTEFADKLGVVSPHGPSHWNCCEGAIEIFEIPPPSCFGSGYEFSTLHHPFILLSPMLFALITYIAFASDKNSILLFSDF